MEVRIYVTQWLSDDGKDVLTMASNWKPYSKEQVLIHESTIEVPSLTLNDLLPAHIAKMRGKQGGLQAEINDIESQIQSLLCIEHKPQTVFKDELTL